MIAVQHDGFRHHVPLTIVVDHGNSPSAVVFKGGRSIAALFLFHPLAYSAFELIGVLGNLDGFILIRGVEKALHVVLRLGRFGCGNGNRSGLVP